VAGNTVVKIQEPQASLRERLRTQAGQLVGRETGLFVVPEIVSFDDTRGEIVFERLRLTGIRQILADGTRSMEVAGKAAEVLTAIHSHMVPRPDECPPSYPDEAGMVHKREAVPLHGDFGMRNIFWTADSDLPVVIDWANADWIGTDADCGAPEIDIAVFMISLFHRRMFGPLPISRRHEVAHHFLGTYASKSPYGLDLPTLKTIVANTKPGFNQRHRRHKGLLRALAYRHSMIDLTLFLGRLSAKYFAGPSGPQRG
jgi:tRNA A-37 threonylcarbamoyl transferase component Bud32